MCGSLARIDLRQVADKLSAGLRYPESLISQTSFEARALGGV